MARETATYEELGEEYGVLPGTVRTWAMRYEDFPKPINKAAPLLFNRLAVKNWAIDNNRWDDVIDYPVRHYPARSREK